MGMQARSSLGKNTDFMVCKMPKMSKNRQNPQNFKLLSIFLHFHGMQAGLGNLLSRCAVRVVTF
jgi:hypothetical protein